MSKKIDQCDECERLLRCRTAAAGKKCKKSWFKQITEEERVNRIRHSTSEMMKRKKEIENEKNKGNWK